MDKVSLKEYQDYFKKTKPAFKYNDLKRKAAKRGIEVTFNLKSYIKLIERACFYCSGPLPDIGYGLDRKDASKDYTWENVVPCCTGCNVLKSDTLTPEQTLKMVATLKREKGEDIWKDLAPNRREKEAFPNKVKTLSAPRVSAPYCYIVIQIPLMSLDEREKFNFRTMSLYFREQIDRRRGSIEAWNFKTNELVFKTNNMTSGEVKHELSARAPGLEFYIGEFDSNPTKFSKNKRILNKANSSQGTARLTMTYLEAEGGRVYSVDVPHSLRHIVCLPSQSFDSTLFISSEDLSQESEYPIVLAKIRNTAK